MQCRIMLFKIYGSLQQLSRVICGVNVKQIKGLLLNVSIWIRVFCNVSVEVAI